MVAVDSRVQVVTTLGLRVGRVTDISATGYGVLFQGEPRPVHCDADSVRLADDMGHPCRECGFVDGCPKWCCLAYPTPAQPIAPATKEPSRTELLDPQVEPSVVIEATREAGQLPSGAVMHKNAFDLESLQQAVNDPVSSPAHYCLPSGIECWDVIDELGMGFLRGSAFEHIWRAGRRGGAADEIADLRKAIRFLQREIASLEAEAGR